VREVLQANNAKIEESLAEHRRVLSDIEYRKVKRVLSQKTLVKQIKPTTIVPNREPNPRICIQAKKEQLNQDIQK